MRSRSSEVFPSGARILRLKGDQRQLLKRPLGRLIRGTPDEVRRKLEAILAGRKGPLIVVVYVTDGRTMREATSEVRPEVDLVVRCRNEPGTISKEAFEAIGDAIRSKKRVHVVIEGEEDLLALAAVYFSPFGGIVVYGQPGEGVVVVEVNEEVKAFVESVLRSMVPEP
jgi:uncharacterized protein (UPF0218 family)